MTLLNDKPDNYELPKSSFERKMIKNILEQIFDIDSGMVSICFPDEPTSSSQYEFCPPRLYKLVTLLVNSDLLLGEYYTEGLWYLRKGDLADFIGYLNSSGLREKYLKYYKFLSSHRGPFFRFKQKLFERKRTEETAEHYDIDPELYSLFLDSDLVYTCAFYENGAQSLSEAQAYKHSLLTERMDINSKSNPKILNVGCGWGGLDRYIVSHHSTATVTGISIATNQIEWCKNIAKDRLEENQYKRLEYNLEGYEQHKIGEENVYDSIVVVGMIEHVGLKNYYKFFNKLRTLLKPNGKLVLHTIVCAENNYPANKWITKHIFPGGFIPSISEVLKSAEDVLFDIPAIHIHSGENYLKTLKQWRTNFIKSWSESSHIFTQKFPKKENRQEFFRAWFFYFSVSQTMFSKGGWRYQMSHFIFTKKD